MEALVLVATGILVLVVLATLIVTAKDWKKIPAEAFRLRFAVILSNMFTIFFIVWLASTAIEDAL